MSELDLVIRGGRVVDGTGAEPRGADVGVRDGVVVEVGRVTASADRVVDADGALVTPGFVDIHTHYDGQVTWDERVTPSTWHGVTTVVAGNCGVGFAPVRPEDHTRLVELMEGVEDIPGTALHEGLSWEWETFAQYLDAVAGRPHDADVGVMIGHAPTRVYVMGERGAEREPASPDEVKAMAAVVRDALRAGAMGFSTSRTLNHRTKGGGPTPTLTAAGEELAGIAAGMAEAGSGIIELISDFDDLHEEFDRLRRMAEAAGRPLHISLNQERGDGRWREVLALIEQANADGLQLRAQVASRAIGLLMGLQATINPFLANPVWHEIKDRPHEDKLAALRDPALRARLLDAAQDDPFVGHNYDRLFPIGDPPDYEPPREASVAAIAEREGRDPAEVTLDLVLRDDGRELLYFPVFNYAAGNLDAQRELLVHPRTVLGLSDGGAHVGTICDASFPTTLLTLWGRDRSRGDGLDLPWLVKAQTHDTAAAVGLDDRGVVAPGYKADLNVIDFERLTARRPEMAFDLPAGGKRLLQRAEGYVATIVAGQVTYEHGQPTGALPGRLLRGPQPRP